MDRRSRAAFAVLVALFCAAACSGSSTAGSIAPARSAPPARDLLGRVASPSDFQITYRTHYLAEGPLALSANAYVEKLWSGSGEVIPQPKLMANLHETNTFCADLCPIEEIVDGTDRYSRAPQTSFSLDHDIGLDFYSWSAILPSALRQATDARVVGQQQIDGHETWVVDALMPNGQAFRVWLRQDAGYAVRLTSSPNAKTPYVDIEIDATNFDRGIAISDPPRSEVFPLYWGTEYHREQPIPLDGGSVTIHVSVYNCHGGSELDDSVSTGFFVSIPFTYTSGGKSLAVDPGVWHVYGELGLAYGAQPVGTSPALVAESLPRGESVSGSMCFFLPFDQNRFALVGDLPGQTVTSFIGGVSLPDASGTASAEGT